MDNFFPESIELFTTTKCNLKCDYCYISKNKALVEYDKEVQACNKNLVYFEKVKNLFEGKEDRLKHMTMWGGEPTIGLANFTESLDAYMNEFPNLYSFHTSSNMTFSNEGFYKFFEKLSTYNNRIFNFNLQMSIDGPPEINNFNRNTNAQRDLNEVIIGNALKLIDHLNEKDYKNLIVKINFKPTLSIDILNNFLTTKDAIIDYFRYFEYVYDTLKDRATSPNIAFVGPALPNFAVPGRYTQEDGKTFNRFVKMCREIERENEKYKLFKYFKRILWFQHSLETTFQDYLHDTLTIDHCSACHSQYCIDSENNMHACHRGFLDSNENYIKYSCDIKDLKIIDQNKKEYELSKKLSKFNVDEFKTNKHLRDQIDDIVGNKDTYLAGTLALIYELSQTGLISECYKDNDELRYLAALFILKVDSCVQDNIMLTGSYYLKTPSLSKLFLNGAVDGEFKEMIGKYEEFKEKK